MGMSYKLSTIRSLIETNLSFQWCRENIIIPLDVKPSPTNNQNTILIAVGNFTYLGTIGDFIKSKFDQNGYSCVFVEKSPKEIQLLLDAAAEERIFSSEGVETFDFSEEDISGSEGKKSLSEMLLKNMNSKLQSLKEFPGIEGVYFTSFVIQ